MPDVSHSLFTGSRPADNAASRDAGFVIVGNPGCRRIELFQAALAAMGLPAARIVHWADLLTRRAHLAEIVRAGDVLRLESPGRNFDVERSLLAIGAAQTDEDDPTGCFYGRVDAAAAKTLSFDKGRILYRRQWYLGFRAALGHVANQLMDCPPHRSMSGASDIAVMFDKCRCHGRLEGAGVTVPRSLGTIRGFDDLSARITEAGWRRVFVKLAHGSSASGVVAYQTSAHGHHQAITTVEMVRESGELRLYNSRRLSVYRDPREIAALIDALARHRVHIEQWLPKAGIDGRVFDLRVLVLAGRARHVVVRLSRGPMTNLHLLNERADSDGVRLQMGERAWIAAMEECERAMMCFPASLHGGIDLLISSGFRSHAILEVNAFGDLLNGVLCDGIGPYEAEINVSLESAPLSASAEEVVSCL